MCMCVYTHICREWTWVHMNTYDARPPGSWAHLCWVNSESLANSLKKSVGSIVLGESFVRSRR